MHRTALVGLSLVGALALGGSAAGDEAPPKGKASLTKMDFGKTKDGTAVGLWTLTNGKGMTVKITNYGGIVPELHVPDKDGKTADVALGFDNLDAYLAGHPYFGAITGRVANRIAGGKFTLGGKTYTLAKNNGPNHLHGGLKGFDKQVWQAEEIKQDDAVGLRLSYTSKDGEEGYPGEMKVTVTYLVTADNELRISYKATTDKATPVNITNHSYFNLAGHDRGTVLDHVVEIMADEYTPVDDTLIPTGKIAAVKGTPLDFTTPTAIGKRIADLKGDPVGYDHNYVLRKAEGDKPRLAARVTEPKSGRVMEVLTTEPGMQLYTGNFLDGKTKGKGGVAYVKHAGFCMETQHFPDAVNQKTFPSVILEPGKTYATTTVYRFSTKK